MKRGIKAGDLVKSVCAICGGKGGGKPDSAMGGGKKAGRFFGGKKEKTLCTPPPAPQGEGEEGRGGE